MAHMISANNISFSYDDKDVIRDISFNASQVDWIGLLGPNGSGKTTLLKLLSSQLRPFKGSIRLMEKDIYSFTKKDLAKEMAVVPQESGITLPFSSFEVVLMGRFSYKKEFGFDTKEDIRKATEAMELTMTSHLASRPITELSGGEKQRVLIARALAQEPKILLLDEPTTFLDIKHQQEILNLLKRLNEERGLTIISAMHDINLALLYCKRILLLKDGSLFKEGNVNEVVTYANLKGLFDTEVYVGINDLNGRPYYLPHRA